MPWKMERPLDQKIKLLPMCPFQHDKQGKIFKVTCLFSSRQRAGYANCGKEIVKRVFVIYSCFGDDLSKEICNKAPLQQSCGKCPIINCVVRWSQGD